MGTAEDTLEGGVTATAVISPSRLARFFYHECDRYLRFSSASSEERDAAGIPAPDRSHGASSAAVVEAGFRWEETVVGEFLGDHAITGTGGPQLRDRILAEDETRQALHQIQPGQFLYQATLPGSRALSRRLKLDDKVVRFAASRPDLVQCVSENGERRLRIIDVKSGIAVKLWHRVQTTLYALMLEGLLEDWRLDGLALTDDSGVWLAGAAQPTLLDLRAFRPAVERFLSDDVSHLMAKPAADAAWHLRPRCEWCQYYSHCSAEMTANDDLSRIPYISAHSKAQLQSLSPPQKTVAALAEARLDDPVLTDQLDATAIGGRIRGLQKQARALVSDTVETIGSYSVSMPKGEHTRILVTVQSEPLSGRTCGYALNSRGFKPVLGENPALVAEVSRTGEVSETQALERRLVHTLHGLLQAVDDYNRDRHDDWRGQRSVQLYALDRHEIGLLVDLLLRTVTCEDDGEAAEKALALLFYLQGPELLAVPQQPDPAGAAFPIVSIVDAARNLLALPVEVVYRLSDLSRILPSSRGSFEYRPSARLTAPLSSQLRPDPILELWHGEGDPSLAESLERELKARLWSMSSVVDGIREALAETDALFAWPPKFKLPTAQRFQHPLLSRLAFLARYESVLAYLSSRAGRTAPLSEQIRRGTLIRLTCLAGSTFSIDPRAVEVGGLEEGWQSDHLLVEDSPDGVRALLAFEDYPSRRSHQPATTAPLAFARITAIDDRAGTADLALTPTKTFPTTGPRRRYLLNRRFTDWTADAAVDELRALDHDADSPIVRVLTQPAEVARTRQIPDPIANEARTLAVAAGMTNSQLDAFAWILAGRLRLIWGPPGTGKTHFLALTALCLIEAHRRHDKTYRPLVAAFTHTAIDNILAKASELQAQLTIVDPAAFAIAKAGATLVDGIETVDQRQIWAWLQTRRWGILGCTAWSARRSYPPERAELVVIDEASQLKLPEASVLMRRLRPDGQMVIAGDDRQLPPIVLGDYPDPPVGQPPLHRSLFEVLRGQDHEQKFTSTLLENFRNNRVICRYPATQLYRPDYDSFNNAIGERRISLARTEADPLIAEIVDPDAALVIGVIDGIRAAAENQVEAELVARVARSLRARLLDSGGRPYDETVEGDRDFWRDGLFIVSPHHAQINAIREHLSAAPALENPFVDTVDRMQGQEADVVITSYGVADPEYALAEQEFIYSVNRLNVAITRARAKDVVFLSRTLIEPPLQAFERESVADGIAFMQGLVTHAERTGVQTEHTLADGASLRLLRVSS
jgi:DNA replication ATP-dependent helicase Dna2